MAANTCFYIIALFLSIYRSLAVINIQRTPQFGTLNFKRLNGHYLNVSVGFRIQGGNFISCAGECRKNKTCRSFNLEKNGDKTLCEILLYDFCSNKDKVVKSSNRDLYYVKLPCCSSPCLNGGQCSNSDDGKKHVCSCQDSYGGQNCENKATQQYCNLYSDVDKLGETLYITSPHDDLGLAKPMFNDKTRSVSCYGIWILYAGGFDAYTNNVLVESKGERLNNIVPPMVGQVTGIRPVGPLIEPFTKDWLVL